MNVMKKLIPAPSDVSIRKALSGAFVQKVTSYPLTVDIVKVGIVHLLAKYVSLSETDYLRLLRSFAFLSMRYSQE